MNKHLFSCISFNKMWDNKHKTSYIKIVIWMSGYAYSGCKGQNKERMLGNSAFMDWVMVKKISIFLPQVWLTNSDKFCLLTSANLPLTNTFHFSRTFSGKSKNFQNNKINNIRRWTQDFWKIFMREKVLSTCVGPSWFL